MFVKNKCLRRAAAACVVFVAAGCGPMPRDLTALRRAAVIYFVNDALDQAAVYVISSARMRTRIGTVMGGQTVALMIPDVIMGAGDVTVAARLLARSGYVSTGPFSLSVGDEYSIRLLSNAATALLILPASERDVLAARRDRP